MSKLGKVLLAILLVLTGFLGYVTAQPGSPGFWVRTDCTALTGPVNDQSICVDGTTHTLRIFTGSAWSNIVQFNPTGILLVGTSVSAGATPGDIVLKNSAAVRFVDVGGTTAIQALSLTTGNSVVLGNNSVSADLQVLTGGTGDIALQPGGVVSTNTKGVRVGSLSGGALTEKLVVIGNSSHEPASGAVAYSRFLGGPGGGKNWRIGTGAVTSGFFEIQDTSDSASAYFSINPSGVVVVGSPASLVSATAGEIVLANNLSLRGTNVGGTGTVQMLRINGADSVEIAPGGGDIRWGRALVSLGGGAAPTFGTIGGSGPATAAQNSWMRVIDSGGVAFWVPVWK